MPENVDKLLEDAARLLSARDYRGCHSACLAALKINPRLAEAYYLLGVLTAQHDNFAKAVELFDRALTVKPGEARYLAQKAKCLTALNLQAEAADAADAAAKAGPEDPLSLDTIGVVLARLGRHADAVVFFRKAATLDPHNASYQYNLGSALQFSGDFSGARQALESSIRLDPDNYKAYTSLTALSKQTDADNHIEIMEHLFAKAEAADEQLQLGHALAKSFEDLAQYDKALSWLARGKAGKRAEIDYDFSEHVAIFDAAEKLDASGADDREIAQGVRPIFVVGMPRTGTTLVDRILSSHSSVASVGELTNFGLILKRAAQTPSSYVLDAETLSAAPALDLAAIGASYLESTSRLRGDAAYFIDKMPLNFFYAPLILKALPSARIILLRRSPMDACLSNYRQLFRTNYSYYNYAFDLKDTGRFYARFDKLAAHWRSALPPSRFLETQYEDIVHDQENQTRKLLSFCDLNWEEACLRFHENAAPVATASSVQVRSPIYSSSIGRWRRYGDALSDLQKTLGDAGVAIK